MERVTIQWTSAALEGLKKAPQKARRGLIDKIGALENVGDPSAVNEREMTREQVHAEQRLREMEGELESFIIPWLPRQPGKELRIGDVVYYVTDKKKTKGRLHGAEGVHRQVHPSRRRRGPGRRSTVPQDAGIGEGQVGRLDGRPAGERRGRSRRRAILILLSPQPGGAHPPPPGDLGRRDKQPRDSRECGGGTGHRREIGGKTVPEDGLHPGPPMPNL